METVCFQTKTAAHMETEGERAGESLTGSQHREGEVDVSPTPKQKLTLAHKSEATFPQWTLFGYVNHTSGQAPCPAVSGQYKTNSKLFS